MEVAVDPETCTQVLQSCKIEAECVGASTYRHFTYFDLKLKPGYKISRIKNSTAEIALAMHSRTPPILKQIPEKGLLRLQVTTSEPETIFLEDLLSRSKKPKGFLPFLIGETDEGQPLWMDISQNPHLLVAGATGSGKSVLLHVLIENAIRVPNLQLYLVDTKLVEFGRYQDLGSVVNIAQNLEDALGVLLSLTKTMETRYQLLEHYQLTKVEEAPDLFPPILVIIDEAADLMLADNSHQFEKTLIKLAAKSRAAGIYLVLATQRPSAEILTGIVRANFPARIACKTSSRVNSQIIIDQPGAENLGGRGDALLVSPQYSLTRFQVAFTSASDILLKNRDL